MIDVYYILNFMNLGVIFVWCILIFLELSMVLVKCILFWDIGDDVC